MTADLTYPLAPYHGARPPAPAWFEAMRDCRPEILATHVGGVPIEVLAWGERGRPGLLLIHGARSHAHWWGPVAPMLAQDFRVASLSFSGMGGSGWRAAYDTDIQIDEIFAAIDIAGLRDAPEAPILIAHSYGAKPASLAAEARGSELSGVILVDSAVSPVNLGRSPGGASRGYPDLAAILARFRLAPPQAYSNHFLLDEVARAGVVERDGAWRWRFDPDLWDKLRYDSSWRAISRPRCPIAFLFGETSAIVTPDRIDQQRRQAPADTPFIGIPQAGHHVMLDQPFALIAAIRALAAGFRITRSR